VIVCEDVPQPVEQPAGAAVARWFAAQDWLAGVGDRELRRSRLRVVAGVVRARQETPSPSGWRVDTDRLEQLTGMHWQLEVDDAVAGVLAACDGSVPLDLPLTLLAAQLGVDDAALWQALAPVVRQLVAHNFLAPVTD
jgi:hypothetical protein